MRKLELLAVFAAFAVASPVMAQGRGRDRDNDRVPPGQRPPAGMCRIWINGVPPGRQPAPTDCSTAAANVPSNGRIIYGDRTNNTYQNSPYSLPGRRGVYPSNGQVVTANGQRCVQRVDANGRTWTTCSRNGAYPNGGYSPNGGYDNRYPNGTYNGVPSPYGYPNGRYDTKGHKHHDQDEDDDRGDDRGDRGNRGHRGNRQNRHGGDHGDDGGN